MTRDCIYCGDEFDPYERDSEGLTRYCSNQCYENDQADQLAMWDDEEAELDAERGDKS